MTESGSNLFKAVAYTLKILFPPGCKTTKNQQQSLQAVALLLAWEEVQQKGAMHEAESGRNLRRVREPGVQPLKRTMP